MSLQGRRWLYLTAVALLPGFTSAQVEIDEPLLLSSPNESERRVQGLGHPNQGSGAVNAETLVTASLIFDEATGTDQIIISLFPPISAYSEGMMLSFAPEQANTGAATLNVDGLGAISIKKNVSFDLDSADLRPDIPVLVVFDGNAFQMIGRYSLPCPAGFIDMTREYCIESESRGPTSFWGAVSTCYSENGRLCTMGEWHYACRTNSTFYNSVLAYEWIDHAANHADYAKRIGMDMNGVPNCFDGSHNPTYGLNRFRCCYNK